MIEYYFEIAFEIAFRNSVSLWIKNCIREEGFTPFEISYIFCDDLMLMEKNMRFLNHKTFTDIISFDYTVGKKIAGDIFISVEAVTRNAKDFNVEVKDEMHRVMIHGILHYCGYKDKTEEEKTEMRAKENYYLALRKFQ